MQAANRRIQDDLARVARERDDAIRELQYFKRQMNERNQNGADMEDQLDRSRQVIVSSLKCMIVADRKWSAESIWLVPPGPDISCKNSLASSTNPFQQPSTARRDLSLMICTPFLDISSITIELLAH